MKIITMIGSILFAASATTTKAFVPKVVGGGNVAFRSAAARTFSKTTSLAMANPQVFFEMEVGGKDIGRIEFELRADVVPKTGMFDFSF